MNNSDEDEYSIVDLLQKLAEDKLESKMIELLSRNLSEEETLRLLLKSLKEEQL